MPVCLRLRRSAALLAPAGLLLLLLAFPASAEDRVLSLQLSVEARQDWNNGLQWSKAGSRQRFEIETRLRSDGRRYADNLLDPDIERRMRIKSEYYTYQGLLRLREEFGGRLPRFDEVAQRIGGAAAQADRACIDAADCPSEIAERFAAVNALQHNSAAELEAFIASYDEPGARYLYFFGYAGCPSRMKLQHTAHFEGEQAHDREQKQLRPFTMDWSADSAGSADDQRKLCQRYVVSFDTQAGVMHLENAYLPSPRGQSLRRSGEQVERRETDLPTVHAVLRWTSDQLAAAAPRGERSADLRITQPLDGNSTVLGAFDGTAKVSLRWSFAAAPEPRP